MERAAVRAEAQPAAEQEVSSPASPRAATDSTAPPTGLLKASEAQTPGPMGLAHILRIMAGIRVENGISEGNNNHTVRGLPGRCRRRRRSTPAMPRSAQAW